MMLARRGRLEIGDVLKVVAPETDPYLCWLRNRQNHSGQSTEMGCGDCDREAAILMANKPARLPPE
jgi:hypothetical protein